MPMKRIRHASSRWLVIALAGVLAPVLAAGPETDGAACIPSVSYLPLAAEAVGRDGNGTAALGSYERISPDGRFILRSYSGAMLGRVTLMELPAQGSGAVKALPERYSVS